MYLLPSLRMLVDSGYRENIERSVYTGDVIEHLLVTTFLLRIR